MKEVYNDGELNEPVESDSNDVFSDITPKTGNSTATCDIVDVLKPAEVRWFYSCPKKTWIPFLGYDSLRVEMAYRELHSGLKGLHSQNFETVSVRGDLYEVDIVNKKCSPIYWNGDSVDVLRGIWFFDVGWQPLLEEYATQIEAEHLAKFAGWKGVDQLNQEDFDLIDKKNKNSKKQKKFSIPPSHILDKNTTKNDNNCKTGEKPGVNKSMTDRADLQNRSFSLTHSTSVPPPVPPQPSRASITRNQAKPITEASSEVLSNENNNNPETSVILEECATAASSPGVQRKGIGIEKNLSDEDKQQTHTTPKNLTESAIQNDDVPPISVVDTNPSKPGSPTGPESSAGGGINGRKDGPAANKNKKKTGYYNLPLHTLKFKDFYVEWYNPNEVYMFSLATSSKLYRSLTYALGFQKTGLRLNRGYCIQANESDKPPDIQHLVFVIHGIGAKLDTSKCIRNCGVMRDHASKLKPKSFLDKGGKEVRAEFFPIEWRANLKLDDGAVDMVSPKNVIGLRSILNTTVMDIMYYTSPIFRNEILTGVQRELNRLYHMFCHRHPTFDRDPQCKVSIIAHSLGTVIIHDILSGWNPSYIHQNYVDQTLTECIEDAKNDNDKEKWSKFAEKLKAQVVDIEKKLNYLRKDRNNLKFRVENLFMLGSPLAVFLVMRGISIYGRSLEKALTNNNNNNNNNNSNINNSTTPAAITNSGRPGEIFQPPASQNSNVAQDPQKHTIIPRIPPFPTAEAIQRAENLATKNAATTITGPQQNSLRNKPKKLDILPSSTAHYSKQEEESSDESPKESLQQELERMDKKSPRPNSANTTSTTASTTTPSSPVKSNTKNNVNTHENNNVTGNSTQTAAASNTNNTNNPASPLQSPTGPDNHKPHEKHSHKPKISVLLPKHICRRIYNIYHPADPVAYRLEPLICLQYIRVKPLTVQRSDIATKTSYYTALPIELYPPTEQPDPNASSDAINPDGTNPVIIPPNPEVITPSRATAEQSTPNRNPPPPIPSPPYITPHAHQPNAYSFEVPPPVPPPTYQQLHNPATNTSFASLATGQSMSSISSAQSYPNLPSRHNNVSIVESGGDYLPHYNNIVTNASTAYIVPPHSIPNSQINHSIFIVAPQTSTSSSMNPPPSKVTYSSAATLSSPSKPNTHQQRHHLVPHQPSLTDAIPSNDSLFDDGHTNDNNGGGSTISTTNFTSPPTTHNTNGLSELTYDGLRLRYYMSDPKTLARPEATSKEGPNIDSDIMNNSHTETPLTTIDNATSASYYNYLPRASWAPSLDFIKGYWYRSSSSDKRDSLHHDNGTANQTNNLSPIANSTRFPSYSSDQPSFESPLHENLKAETTSNWSTDNSPIHNVKVKYYHHKRADKNTNHNSNLDSGTKTPSNSKNGGQDVVSEDEGILMLDGEDKIVKDSDLAQALLASSGNHQDSSSSSNTLLPLQDQLSSNNLKFPKEALPISNRPPVNSPVKTTTSTKSLLTKDVRKKSIAAKITENIIRRDPSSPFKKASASTAATASSANESCMNTTSSGPSQDNAPGGSDGSSNRPESPEENIPKLDRVDYTLPPGWSFVNTYVSAITAHTSYWNNPDVIYFILQHLFPDQDK